MVPRRVENVNLWLVCVAEAYTWQARLIARSLLDWREEVLLSLRRKRRLDAVYQPGFELGLIDISVAGLKTAEAPSTILILSQELAHQGLPLLIQFGIESLLHLILVGAELPAVLLSEVQLLGLFVFDVLDFLAM